MSVTIEPLLGHGHLASVLARWHHDEWGHLYDPNVWSRSLAEHEFDEMARPGSVNTTWVAFDGHGRTADDVLGSVSLVADDDLDGFDHLTPWLASLFVVERARGRGVGGALVDTVMSSAQAVGHDDVYLFTSGQESFWSERGWSVLARVDATGHPATVMACATHPHEPAVAPEN